MQYHLDTIPLWEVMERRAQCPFCALYHKNERSEVERALGGSVMEPASRIRVNERGICAEHHSQLLAQNNRLGHALLTASHCKELLKKLNRLPNGARAGLSSLWGNGGSLGQDKLPEQLRAFSEGCVICDTLASHMGRYYYTFLHLWENDGKFKALWEASPGACMPHACDLLDSAGKHLPASRQRELSASVLALLKKTLAREEKDLEYFTSSLTTATTKALGHQQKRPGADFAALARRLWGGAWEECRGFVAEGGCAFLRRVRKGNSPPIPFCGSSAFSCQRRHTPPRRSRA